jgi:FkbM family methyltransferase
VTDVGSPGARSSGALPGLLGRVRRVLWANAVTEPASGHTLPRGAFVVRRSRVRLVATAGYAVRIVRTIANWGAYLLHYLGVRAGPTVVRFRNGLTLRDTEGTIAGTIAVVFIRRHYGSLSRQAVIVDVGANVGAFSVYAAHACPRAVVYSYEPVAANFRLLCGNIAENRLGHRVRPVQRAVAAKAGTREMRLSASPLHTLAPTAVAASAEPVLCTTLADIVRDNGLAHIDLLKLNCEGSEYEILYGSRNALLVVREVRMEYHTLEPRERCAANLCGYLQSIGFVIDLLEPMSAEDGFLWAHRAAP